jgi:hypothetical protein
VNHLHRVRQPELRGCDIRCILLSAISAAAPIGFRSFCEAAQPERVVRDHVVISRHDPAAQIKLPDAFRYVGADRFLLTDPSLGDFDDCELHAFVESDAARTIHALYWVQFEAICRITHIYSIRTTRRVTLRSEAWIST